MASFRVRLPLQAAKVTIKREARTKRKTLTCIHNLEAFGIDLKKAAKFFAQRFATGSSVSKNPQGQDEIVIQGDVWEEVVSVPCDRRFNRVSVGAVLGRATTASSKRASTDPLPSRPIYSEIC